MSNVNQFEKHLICTLNANSEKLSRDVLYSSPLTKSLVGKGQMAFEDSEYYHAVARGRLDSPWKVSPFEITWDHLHSILEVDLMASTKYCDDAAASKMAIQVTEAAAEFTARLMGPKLAGRLAHLLRRAKSPDTASAHTSFAWKYNPTEDGICASGLTTSAIERVVCDLCSVSSEGPDMVITSYKQWRKLYLEIWDKPAQTRAEEMRRSISKSDIGFPHFWVEGIPIFYFSRDCVSDTYWREDDVAVLNSGCLKLLRHSTEWLAYDGPPQIRGNSALLISFNSRVALICTDPSRQAIIKY